MSLKNKSLINPQGKVKPQCCRIPPRACCSSRHGVETLLRHLRMRLSPTLFSPPSLPTPPPPPPCCRRLLEMALLCSLPILASLQFFLPLQTPQLAGKLPRGKFSPYQNVQPVQMQQRLVNISRLRDGGAEQDVLMEAATRLQYRMRGEEVASLAFFFAQ